MFHHGLLFTGMPESPTASFGFINHIYWLPNYFCYLLNYHLRNPVTILYGLRFIGKIDQDHFNLPPIIGIDGARGI